MKRLVKVSESEEQPSNEEIESYLDDLNNLSRSLWSFTETLEQIKNNSSGKELDDSTIAELESEVRSIIADGLWDEFRWNYRLKPEILKLLPEVKVHIEAIDSYFAKMSVSSIKKNASSLISTWTNPFFYLLSELDKYASIIGYNLAILKTQLKKIRDSHIEHVEKTILKKKYPIKELTKDQLGQILDATLDIEKYNDYQYSDVSKLWDRLVKLSNVCDNIVEQLSQITGLKLNIKTFFYPSHELQRSTSTGGAAAFWDSGDNSINFTLASANYTEKHPTLEFEIDTDYVESLVLHEAGHMIDTTLGNPSSSPEFISLLKEINFNPSTQKKYKTYYEYDKKAEAFADLMVHWAMGEKMNQAHAKLEYNTKQNQLINEYFTSLIDRAPYEENDYNQSEYDENGNVKPEVQQIRNFEKKTSRLRGKR